MAQIASIPWHYLAAVAHLCRAVLASAHILWTPRESSTAIAWVGVVWLAPMLGPILSFLLGDQFDQVAAFRITGNDVVV